MAFPFDGGIVAWIDKALGGFMGVHNAYWYVWWFAYVHEQD